MSTHTTSTKKSSSNGKSSSTKAVETAISIAAGKKEAAPAKPKPVVEQTPPADLELNTEVANAKREKLPMARRIEKQVRLAVVRWQNLAKFVQGWDEGLDGALNEVIKAGKAAHATAQELPNDLKRPSKRSGGASHKPLEEGAMINVSEAARKHYTGVIDDSDMLGLKVKRVAGKKVVASTVSGETVILPRAHVSIAKDSTAN